MNEEETKKYIENNFITEEFIDWETAIDNGHVIFTAYYVETEIYFQKYEGTNIHYRVDVPIYHNVLVVGYNNDGSLIYYDPETGDLETSEPNQFDKPAYKAPASSCK